MTRQNIFEKMRKLLTAASKTLLQDSNIFMSLGTKLPKRCLLPERGGHGGLRYCGIGLFFMRYLTVFR